MVRNFIQTVIRDIANLDVCFGCSVKINVINTNTTTRNYLAVLKFIDNFTGNVGIGDKQSVCLTGNLENCIRCRLFSQTDVSIEFC